MAVLGAPVRVDGKLVSVNQRSLVCAWGRLTSVQRQSDVQN